MYRDLMIYMYVRTPCKTFCFLPFYLSSPFFLLVLPLLLLLSLTHTPSLPLSLSLSPVAGYDRRCHPQLSCCQWCSSLAEEEGRQGGSLDQRQICQHKPRHLVGTHTHTISLSLSLTHSHTHTHSLAYSLTRTHSLTHSHTLSLSLSLSHTHTHTHTHTLTHTPVLIY